MDPKTNKNTKKTYFSSPKKEPLAKKMIFDPHQVQFPSSCYELRPIHENQSNQQEIIFDPNSSSLREISEFEKNSPHDLDKMIYGHNENSNSSEHSYIDCDREENSDHSNFKIHEESMSHSEIYHPIKRENPISHEQTQKYENIAKMVQISETQNHSTLKKQELQESSNYYNSNEGFRSPAMKTKPLRKDWISLAKSQRKAKWPSKAFNSSIKKDKIFNQDMEEDYEEKKQDNDNNQLSNFQQVLQKTEQVKIEELSPDIKPIERFLVCEKKTPRKKIIDNPEFQLINQYMELASYAALIDEMIFVYDKSPLFEFPLDFNSDPEEDDEDQQSENMQEQQNQQNKNEIQMEDQVKIEHFERENMVPKKAQQISKSEKEFYSQFEKMKIEEASDEKEKQRIIKEITFNRSKTYLNFYEPIKQLKPYMKKMTLEEKKLFLSFKKELKEIKDIIDYFQRKNQGDKKDHICKLCGEEFQSGRQLGGHMSRKHPGKAIEYGFKKELHKIKEIERNRRKYFKGLEDGMVKQEHKED